MEALLKDPLLADVPADVTLDEVRTLVALETGQAMRVTVVRYDGGRIDIVVRQGATVKELKRGVALQVTRREGSGINWTYIWRRYALTSGPVKLEPDDARVHDFGVRAGSELGFVRRLHERKHGRRRANAAP